jgi:hypothetical protein
MNFEFVIAYRRTEETNLPQVLAGLLNKVLEDNLTDLEPETIEQMIHCRQERIGEETIDDNGAASRHMLLCFTLELPDGIEQIETVVEEFAATLPDTSPIFHAVKFEDPLLHAELARRAEEIYVLEMKLRRVLTFIYLHANQDTDPYDLLHDETVKPMCKEKLQPTQLKAAAENEFFYLTFGQYIGLNQKPEFKLPALLQLVHDEESYEAFRFEVVRSPIEQEDDAIFLAGLKERMDAIETMRNCVAHNRRPSKRVTENYENARPLLNRLLDDYLGRWERPAEAMAPAPPIGANHQQEN